MNRSTGRQAWRKSSSVQIAVLMLALLSSLMPTVGYAQAGAPEDVGNGSNIFNAPRYVARPPLANAASLNTVFAAGLSSDNFNACTLDTDLWTLTDPKNQADFETDGQSLLITVPEGVDYDLWEDKNFAARATQDITSDDFQIVAKFESDLGGVTENQFKLQGIIVEGTSDSNVEPIAEELLRFEFYSIGTVTGFDTYALGAVIRPDGEASPFLALSQKINVPVDSPMYMRVTRATQVIDSQATQIWTMEYSFTGNGSDWVTVPPVAGDPNGPFILRHTSQRVGVYAGSTSTIDPASAPGHTAIVDYFLATEDPITVTPDDDTKGYDVTTDTLGQGSVAVEPNDPGPYACGDPITLTANPASGWAFVEWTGDVTGTTNPTTVEFDMGLSATANFAESSQNTLNVTLSGQGTVTSTPAGINCGVSCSASYSPGTEVSLTAVPTDGWSFAGWTGDVTSADPTISVTMDANVSLTANFTELSGDFKLTVQQFGEGTVQLTPDKELYDAGEVVTVTAVLTDGWSFVGWSGAATGTDLSVAITMDRDQVIIASFSEDEYILSVIPIGGGSIEIAGGQTTYKFGDKVTLTAIPDTDWIFQGWSGDLSGEDNPVEVTITGNTSISAIFVEVKPEFSSYLPLLRTTR